jgi:hypothetical protein
MLKRSRFAWAVFFVFLIAAVFLFRYEIINRIQQEVLNSIRNASMVSNRDFAGTDSLHQQHLIYSLKGADRIWPHRVNSLKRLRYLYKQFAGFECDIRFNAGDRKLFIAHDPVEISPLTFVDYLQQADPEHKLFWLDIKNLDSINIIAFCEQLRQLDQQFTIKNRVIIESPDTSALNHIAKLGYLTSLYLPWIRNDLINKQSYIDKIYSFLKTNSTYISQDCEMHDFMTKKFPGNKQLIWDIRFWNSLNKDILLNHLNDTALLVCLINVKSPGYR